MNTYKVKVKGFRMVPVEEVIDYQGHDPSNVVHRIETAGMTRPVVPPEGYQEIKDMKVISVIGNDDEYYPQVEWTLESVTSMSERGFYEHKDPTKVKCSVVEHTDGQVGIGVLPVELSEEDVTWVRAWEPIYIRVSSEVYMESFSEEDIPDGEDENDYVSYNYRTADYDSLDLENYELLEGYQPRFTEVGKSKIRALLIDRLLSDEKVA